LQNSWLYSVFTVVCYQHIVSNPIPVSFV